MKWMDCIGGTGVQARPMIGSNTLVVVNSTTSTTENGRFRSSYELIGFTPMVFSFFMSLTPQEANKTDESAAGTKYVRLSKFFLTIQIICRQTPFFSVLKAFFTILIGSIILTPAFFLKTTTYGLAIIQSIDLLRAFKSGPARGW